jgi:hypothetical protein
VFTGVRSGGDLHVEDLPADSPYQLRGRARGDDLAVLPVDEELGPAGADVLCPGAVLVEEVDFVELMGHRRDRLVVTRSSDAVRLEVGSVVDVGAAVEAASVATHSCSRVTLRVTLTSG